MYLNTLVYTELVLFIDDALPIPSPFQKKWRCFKIRPKGLPFGFFSEIGSFSTLLDLSTDLDLMSHLITCTCSERAPDSTRTFT
jgi:hypothetical protein